MSDMVLMETENILRQLEKNGVIVILTSNMPPEKIPEIYPEQVYSRIMSMVALIKTDGKDYRL